MTPVGNPSLPIAKERAKIEAQVSKTRVVLLVGETGCGKTTQVPQFLSAAGLGRIAVTQPRRLAAMTVAGRVATEQGCPLGGHVGYKVRFDDKTSSRTAISFLTDGMLLREAMSDPDLSRYDCIVLDEAHERTVATDVLLGLVRLLLSRRPQLRIVVMSATLSNRAEFERFFSDFSVGWLHVRGRAHPVTSLYAAEPHEDYLDAAVSAVLQLHITNAPPGDILVFLTGQEEIESASHVLEKKRGLLAPGEPKYLVCPLFAALPAAQQLRAFEPAPDSFTRKVILSTNIAETSITIAGVQFVVDCGRAKKRFFVSRGFAGMDVFLTEFVSRAEAWQRAGRAGRDRPGACIRLYTEKEFDGFHERATAEILRSNLTEVCLQLLALGKTVPQIMGFPWLAPPSAKAMKRALWVLERLGALDECRQSISPQGRKLAAFPVHPSYTTALLRAAELGCWEEMLIIVSLLTVNDSVWMIPTSSGARSSADKSRRRFGGSGGDHLALLAVFDRYGAVPAGERTMWCRRNYVSERALRQAQKVRSQLRSILVQVLGAQPKADRGEDTPVRIRKCLAFGCFLHAAILEPRKGTYTTLVSNQEVKLHPSSSLFGRKGPPQAIVYNDLVVTSSNFVRNVSPVDLAWLPPSLRLQPQLAASSLVHELPLPS